MRSFKNILKGPGTTKNFTIFCLPETGYCESQAVLKPVLDDQTSDLLLPCPRAETVGPHHHA